MYVLPWGDYFAPNNFVVSYILIVCRTNNLATRVSCVSRFFVTARVPAQKRVGPHSWHFCQIAIGLLLSDAYAEKHGLGVRLSFKQSSKHKSFFNQVANEFYSMGYIGSNTFQPRITTDSKGNKHLYYKFNTFTFSSLFWLHELFYVDGVKVIKPELKKYITPLSLAYWIAGDGGWSAHGMHLATHSFTYKECLLLKDILFENLGIICTVRQDGSYVKMYVKHQSMDILRKHVLPHLDQSMHYKVKHNKNIV